MLLRTTKIPLKPPSLTAVPKNVDNPMLTAEMTASIEKLGEEKPSAHPKIVSFGGRPRGHPPAHYAVKATDAKINVVIALRVEPQRVFGKHCLALFFSPLLPPLFSFVEN